MMPSKFFISLLIWSKYGANNRFPLIFAFLPKLFVNYLSILHKDIWPVERGNFDGKPKEFSALIKNAQFLHMARAEIAHLPDFQQNREDSAPEKLRERETQPLPAAARG